MASVSTAGATIFHWAEGFVKMFSEGPSEATPEEVKQTCFKMYQNRVLGLYPKHMKDLEEQIEGVNRTFELVKASSDLETKLTVFTTNFFKEISDITGCSVEEKDQQVLFSKHLPTVLKAVNGSYLLENEKSKIFLESYAVASFKNVSKQILALVENLTEEQSKKYGESASQLGSELYNDIRSKKVTIEDLSGYIKFLVEKHLDNKLPSEPCPESMIAYDKTYSQWQVDNFFEQKKLYWQVRVALLQGLLENVQSS